MDLAAASETRKLEPIFIATPPCTPLITSITRTTTPRDLPTMYHFDFATMESDPVDNDQIDEVNELESPGPITTGASIPVPEHAAVGDLSECPCCKRTFNPNALRKHVAFCGKKRKVFDSSRQRREGTALSTYVLPKNFGLPNAEKAAGLHTPPGVSRESSSIASGGSQQLPPTDAAASPASTRRKTNTDQARATARSSLKKAAGAATAETPGAAAAPPGLTRDRMRSSDRSISKRIKDTASERCPHCERSFNPKAFDRHVEWCKEKAIQANIKAANTVETNKAKERMEARKQYRPPNLKTKRSLNRDKYSGSIEEQQQYEAEMVAQKQTLMSLSAMTSSVQSDNSQRTEKLMKAPRPGTSQQRQAPVKPKSPTTQITQKTVSLCVASAEEANTFKLRRKQRETCQEIDVAVDRLRRKATEDTLQLAKLDCIEAAPLLPAKSRRRTTRPKLVEAAEKLIAPDQAICTFEDLNGLLLRKAGSKICNIKMNMNEQELNVGNKTRSTTSLVRQAHRRPRTKTSPVLDLQSLEAPKAISSFDLTGIEKSSAGACESSHAGSDNESNSLCGEIRLKMETCTIRTLRPPKKREHLPTIMNSCEPLRALPMAERKESVKDVPRTQLPVIESKDVPRDHYKEDRFLDADNGMLSVYNDCEYDDADIEVGQFMDIAKSLTDDESEPLDELETDNEREHRDAKKLSPFRQRSNVSRRLVLLEQDEEAVIYIKATSPSSSPTSRRARSSPGSECPLLNSGISPLTNSKYDPFLSAKRQLEELCSPGTPPDIEPSSSTATHTPNTTLKVTPMSMSTSLTGSLSKPQTTLTTPTTAKTTPTSNFRRTSSLRGPRRTPLLPSRPLFATNYRPTIQRGLSDEGPISTNFLKPEEYDEMPVRAACGNDFHSPRVVRRDTSASNRKQQLKLPLGVGNETVENSSNESKQQQPVRNVAKTDSLAVFLKYEHELEQLNAKAAEVTAISKELNSKELKDKSNNLSKQNSAKNLTTSSGQLPPLTTPVTTTSTPVAKENNENQVFNYATPLRLEPISKPTTPQLNSTTQSTGNNSSSSGVPIKLESIFGNNRLGDYIDPLLINPCDNLHVQQQAQSSTGSSNASSTPHQQLSQSRCSSQSTITMGQDQQRNSGDARNLLKRKMRLGRNQFLYDASPEEAYISSGSCADDEANRSSLEFDEQCWQQQQKQLLSNPISMPLTMPNMPPLPTFDDFDFEEFLSSFENENDEEQFPLFRDCREFLLNRTTNRQRSFQKATSTPHTQSQSQSQAQTQNQTQTPTQTKPQSQTPTTATQRATPSGISSQLIMSPSSQYYTASTKESYAHRSDSNASSKTSQSSNRSYKSMNSFDENTQKSLDDSQKREIFISIETEANAQGHSPISPQSLRHMVGNAQTPIDVLHIENGNEPEHAKFSKISDTEEDHLDAEIEDDARHVHYSKRSVLSSIPAPTLPLPNVRANNAKNEIEKRLGEFKQIGEEFGDSLRRNVLQHQEHVQQVLKCNSHLSPSPSGDSDELSSLDGYPMSSSQSSRRGASSKLSSDSAYGSSNSPNSLSQRSGDKQLHISNAQRSQKQLRPHTAGGALASSSGKPASRSNKSDASTQAQTNYGTLKARQQLYAGIGPSDGQAGYSSSCSEISLPVAQPQQQQQQNSNFNYHQQQQHQHQQQSQVETAYNNNNNNNNNNYEHNAQNNMNNNTINAASTALASSQHSLSSNTSNGSSSMTASMKMSNYCYECGSKFMIGHAKFCVECGVKRVAL